MMILASWPPSSITDSTSGCLYSTASVTAFTSCTNLAPVGAASGPEPEPEIGVPPLVPPLPDVPEFLRGRQMVVIDGAVLVTNGAFGDLSPMMDQFAVSLLVSRAERRAADARRAGREAEALGGGADGGGDRVPSHRD